MLTFIVNPAAGSGRAVKAGEALEQMLAERGEAYRVVRTERPGHATELAREAAASPDCSGVVAVGGDGTAFETACGLLDSGVPMGIISVGTGNDFIKTLGTPADMRQALDFILTKPPRPADVCRLNDRLFLNVSGTGFDVTVLDCMEDVKKRFHGILPYLIGVVRAIFRYRPVHVVWMADGECGEEDVLLCAVANGRFIGGGIPICPDATPDDGLLDLVVVENKPRWQLPFYLPGLLMGRVLRFPFTRHRRCRTVTIASPGMRMNVDGEILPTDEAVLSVMPGRLKLFW